ncbi:MAG: hypothetical protein OHK0017_10080 [Patescibacteria group bacterium]
MRTLALDIGMTRTGYAFGNTELGVALTRPQILLTQNLERFLLQENTIERIELLIVGIPTNRNSEATSMTQFALEKIKLITEILPDVKIIQVNEKSTSRVADKNLKEAVKSTQKVQMFNDNEAARILLQEYLDKV